MSGEGRPGEGEEPLTEADVERMIKALGMDDGAGDHATGPGAADDAATAGAPGTAPAEPAAGRPARIALVLTPVASAPGLAGLCAMAGIDVSIVPSGTGAVAVLELPARAPAEEWDISELTGGGEHAGPSPQAQELAANLSRLSRAGVVLLTADLATDVGIESGLSGQLSAWRYAGGAIEGDVPAGLILASADQVVEDLILGRRRAHDVRGHLRTGDLPRWKAARLFGKGLRRRNP